MLGPSGYGSETVLSSENRRPHRQATNPKLAAGMSDYVDLVALLTRYGELAAELEECTDARRADVLGQRLGELDRQLNAAQQRLRCEADQ